MCAEATTTTRVGLKSAILFFALNGAMFGAWAVRIPDVKLALDLTEARLGLVLLAAAAGAVVSFGLAARAADRWGAGHVAAVCGLAMAAVVAALPWMPGPLSLAAMLFCLGASGGSMDLTMNAYATEVEARAARSRMSLLHGCWSLGLAVSAGAAAAGLANVPTALHLGIVGAIGALGVAFAWSRAIEPGPHSRGGDARAALISIPRGAMVPVGLICGIAFLSEGAAMDWAGVLIRVDLGGSPAQGALVLSLLSLSLMVIRLAGDPVIDRVGPVAAGRVCGAAVALGALGVTFVASPEAGMLAFAVMGIGLSLLAPLCFSKAGREGTSGSGEAVAAVAMTGYGGILLGPALMGFTAEAIGLGNAFGLIAVGGLILIPLARSLR